MHHEVVSMVSCLQPQISNSYSVEMKRRYVSMGITVSNMYLFYLTHNDSSNIVIHAITY